MWVNLESNWNHFFWLTGETSHTLGQLVWDLQAEYDTVHRLRREKSIEKIRYCDKILTYYPNNLCQFICLILNHIYIFIFMCCKVLLCMIWLWQYPTMSSIACQFGIPVSCVHKIIHRMIKYLHAFLVPKYIRWHSMRDWQKLQGFYPEWPRVVAILDCTPFRISKPKGQLLS